MVPCPLTVFSQTGESLTYPASPPNVFPAMEHLDPKRRRNQDTRQRVLKAAAELFATRGYAATSISAISKASGVLPSSMYWEFGNKAGIFAAVLEDSASRWVEETTRSVVRAIKERPGSKVDPLTAYFDYMAQTLAEGPEFLRLMFMVALEGRHADPHALEVVRSHRARSIESVTRVLAACGLGRSESEGATERDIALLTIACFDGAFLAAQVDADVAETRRMLRLLRSAMTALVKP
jgi:AcrR family transcriptional regulator